ncbi:MAG: hypothetical protein ABF289_03095, partial [Clostridiales bacterium]
LVAYIIGLFVLFRLIDGEYLKIGKGNFRIKYYYIYIALGIVYLFINILSILNVSKINEDQVVYKSNFFNKTEFSTKEIKNIEVGYYENNNAININYSIVVDNKKINIAKADAYIENAKKIDDFFIKKNIEINRTDINEKEYLNMVKFYSKDNVDKNIISNIIKSLFMYKENN